MAFINRTFKIEAWIEAVDFICLTRANRACVGLKTHKEVDRGPGGRTSRSPYCALSVLVAFHSGARLCVLFLL